MAAKTEMLKCDLDLKKMKVVMYHALRTGKDGQEWTKAADSVSEEFDLALLPEAIANQCLLYGVRAKLQDSCSDFRKHGIKAYMDGMRSMFDEVLMAGEWNRKVKRDSAVDMALVEVVAKLKQISPVAAEAALKKLEREQRDALMVKFADEVAEVRKQMSEGAATDLDDLL